MADEPEHSAKPPQSGAGPAAPAPSRDSHAGADSGPESGPESGRETDPDTDPEDDPFALPHLTSHPPATPEEEEEDDDGRTRFGSPLAPAPHPAPQPAPQPAPHPHGAEDRTRFMPPPPRQAPPTAPPEGDEATNPPASVPPESVPPAADPGPTVLARPDLARPDLARPDLSASAPKKAPAIVAPGTLINNNYEVTALINAGGMGEVYRGINPLTGDAVAIKIVLQSLAHDEKIAALFRREARVLCQLSDQAIVRYYNFVHDAQLDRFCLIMEFIDGITLLDHAREVAPLTVDQAAALLRRLALGLEQAHKREVIHRDLSPDNVILRGGRIDDAVLIDFGIAKSAEMAENTLHGQLAGKFKYISPEQLGSFGGEIGPRTDIYSLALVIAAGLRGMPIDMGASIHEAVQARMQIPDLAGIPERLRPLLAHMLEPDPARRPARMSDVLALLDDPGLIPAEYGADPFAGGFTGVFAHDPSLGGGISAPPGSLPGPLQRPPGSAPRRNATTMAGGSRPQGTLTQGFSSPPQFTTQAAPDTPPAPRQRGGAGGVIRVVVLLALLGGGGYVAYDRGLLDSVLQGSAAAPTDAPPDTATATPSGTETATTTPGTPTRDGFLAAFDTGPCSFAARIAAGPEAGQIAGFTATPGAFAALPDAYATAFDIRPDVAEKPVAATQCAVLDLARSVQAQAGQAPVVTLDSDRMREGGSIVGRISDRRGRPVWVVLVTGAGAVYNLTGLLAEQADGSATFSFGLSPAAPGEAAEHLILALATDTPLVSAAAATDGTAADQLMPLIAAEIAGRSTRAGVALAQFVLEP